MEHNTVIRELRVWSMTLTDCHCVSNFPAPQHCLQPHLQLLPQLRGAASFQDHLSAPGLPRHCCGHGGAAEDRQEPGNSEPGPLEKPQSLNRYRQSGSVGFGMGCWHRGTFVSPDPHWNAWSHGLIFTGEESQWFLWDPDSSRIRQRSAQRFDGWLNGI